MSQLHHTPIVVAPYATNVLDLVGRQGLCTPDGRKIEVKRSMIDFMCEVEGEKVFITPSNLVASRFLNSYEVGTMA